MALLLPERPDPVRVTALVPIAEQVEAREPGAIRAMFEATGRVVGWLDVRSAAGSNGVDTFVEGLLLPEIDGRVGLTDAQLIELFEAVSTVSLPEALDSYALERLAVELDQPHVSDLIFWSAAGTPTDAPSRLALARSTRGRALIPYLDPLCKLDGPETMTLAQRPTKEAVRPILVEMAESNEIEISMGETAVAWLALGLADLRTGADLAARLCADASGVAEVFADDETLAARLAAMRPR